MAILVVASGIALGAESPLEKTDAGSGFASVGVSFVRILGAFGLVLTLFFGGVWAVRNWARIAPRRGSVADLKVLEVRSIGVRQNLVVVGYRRQRLLLSATAGGVTLLTHLPEAETEEEPVRETAEAVSGKPDFVGAFRQVLARGS